MFHHLCFRTRLVRLRAEPLAVENRRLLLARAPETLQRLSVPYPFLRDVSGHASAVKPQLCSCCCIFIHIRNSQEVEIGRDDHNCSHESRRNILAYNKRSNCNRNIPIFTSLASWSTFSLWTFTTLLLHSLSPFHARHVPLTIKHYLSHQKLQTHLT